jgi:hypothetical protein
LNWFKFRPEDPQIGRFWQVDLLATDYPHNSTYAFSENKVIRHVELDGLEAVPVYPNPTAELFKSTGFHHNPGPEESFEIGGKLLKLAGEAFLKASLIVAPVEELLIGGLTGLGLKAEGLLTRPQGISSKQFGELSKILKDKVGDVGDNIYVHGSRAKGTAKETSDIDIGVGVSEEKFNMLLEKAFGTPNIGSAKERTMQHAMKTGKIQAGEAKLTQTRKQIEDILGMNADISIIRQGSQFDKGPKIFIK